MVRNLLVERKTDKILVFLFALSLLCITIGKSAPSWLDEAIAVSLFLFMFLAYKPFRHKEFKVFVLIMLGYLLYSFILGVNVPQAAIFDLMQFMKPFISFYAIYYASVRMSGKTLKKFSLFCIILGMFFYLSLPYIAYVYGNSAGLANASLLVSFTYYAFSRHDKRAKVIALLILFPGFFALKAKFVATFVFFVYIIFFLKEKIKFNIKYICLISLLVCVAIYFNFEKFSAYFITGFEDGMARAYLYYYGFVILFTYIPFGSGLGTFGTEATRQYYSPLYYKYGINEVWGCAPEDAGTAFSFIADTFFPVLAEFGICGVILFFVFWKRRYKTICLLQMNMYKMGIIMIFFVMIHSVADSGIMLGPSSISTFMLLGYICSQWRLENELKKRILKTHSC